MVENIVAGEGSPEGGFLHIISMKLSELCSPHAGSRTPGRGQVVEVGAVVAVCHPDHLTIGEAGSGGEAHRSGVGCFGILQGHGAGVNTPTTPETHRSRSAPLACAHSRRRSQRGTNARRQTPERCARRWCRWRGERNPRGCRRRSCQGRTRSGSRGGQWS